MNLNYLPYFRVLAQTEHYTQAAQLLSITQPSLSHAIAALEADLGTFLFEKQGRNVKLTKYGRMFYEYIEKGLHEIDAGEQFIRNMTSADKGHIDLAFIYTLGSYYVPSLIHNFLALERNQNIRFSFKQGSTINILKGLKEERYDVAFCSYVEQEEDIHFLPIAQEELVLIVSKEHPLAQKDAIDLSETKDLPFVYYDTSSGIRPIINKLFAEIHISPNIVCQVEEDHAVAGLVAINYGVAVMPNIADLSHYPIKILPIINPAHERYIYLATVKNRYLSPAVHNFCNFVIHNASLPKK